MQFNFEKNATFRSNFRNNFFLMFQKCLKLESIMEK